MFSVNFTTDYQERIQLLCYGLQGVLKLVKDDIT